MNDFLAIYCALVVIICVFNTSNG